MVGLSGSIVVRVPPASRAAWDARGTLGVVVRALVVGALVLDGGVVESVPAEHAVVYWREDEPGGGVRVDWHATCTEVSEASRLGSHAFIDDRSGETVPESVVLPARRQPGLIAWVGVVDHIELMYQHACSSEGVGGSSPVEALVELPEH